MRNLEIGIICNLTYNLIPYNLIKSHFYWMFLYIRYYVRFPKKFFLNDLELNFRSNLIHFGLKINYIRLFLLYFRYIRYLSNYQLYHKFHNYLAFYILSLILLVFINILNLIVYYCNFICELNLLKMKFF